MSSLSRLQRGAAPLAQFVGHVVEHLHRGGEGHQRRPQLVADLGRESSVAGDPLLKGPGHLVERGGERGQVGVVGRGQAGVQGSSGQRLGRSPHLEQRVEQPARGPPADGRREQGGDGGHTEEDEGQRVQGLLDVVEGRGLEVDRVGGGARYGDGGDDGGAGADRGAHPRRDPRLDQLQQRGGHRLLVEHERVGRGPLIADPKQRERARGLPEPLDDGPPTLVVGLGCELVSDPPTVVGEHRECGVVALLQEVLAGQGQGGEGDRGCQQQPADGEGGGDAPAESPPDEEGHDV